MTTKTHTAVPEIGTCTGVGCSGGDKPGHTPHRKFFCTCGQWFATARGRAAHFNHEESYLTIAAFKALVEAAGHTLNPNLVDT